MQALNQNSMKKVRLIFVGIMLAIVCVGFTSCGHEADMDPIGLETVELNDVESEGSESEDEGSNGNGSSNGKDT